MTYAATPATRGYVDAAVSGLSVQVADLQARVLAVESKLQGVLLPGETLALLGVEDVAQLEALTADVRALTAQIQSVQQATMSVIASLTGQISSGGTVLPEDIAADVRGLTIQVQLVQQATMSVIASLLNRLDVMEATLNEDLASIRAELEILQNNYALIESQVQDVSAMAAAILRTIGDGTGTNSLGNLIDVDVTGVLPGYLLSWNGSKWVDIPPGSGGMGGGGTWGSITGTLSDQADLQAALNAKSPVGHLHTVDNLSDVAITAVADDELLSYESSTSEWINKTPAEAGLSVVGHPHPELATSGHTHAWGSVTGTLSNQTDLQAALDAKASGVHSHTLDGLSDVSISGVADNEVLAFDQGSNQWINQTPSEAGLSEAGHTHPDLAPSGHSHPWGSITGTLGNQTDLQSALDLKSPTSHSHTLDALSDVIAVPVASGAILTFVPPNWVPSSGILLGYGGAPFNVPVSSGNPGNPVDVVDGDVWFVWDTGLAALKLRIKYGGLIYSREMLVGP